MYTTVDQIEAILSLYKDPFNTEKITREDSIMDYPVVQVWQDQTWQDQTWQDQTWQDQTWRDQTYLLFINELFEEFSLSPLTMFIYSVN
jgi:hypothetical protein